LKSDICVGLSKICEPEEKKIDCLPAFAKCFLTNGIAGVCNFDFQEPLSGSVDCDVFGGEFGGLRGANVRSNPRDSFQQVGRSSNRGVPIDSGRSSNRPINRLPNRGVPIDSGRLNQPFNSRSVSTALVPHSRSSKFVFFLFFFFSLCFIDVFCSVHYGGAGYSGIGNQAVGYRGHSVRKQGSGRGLFVRGGFGSSGIGNVGVGVGRGMPHGRISNDMNGRRLPQMYVCFFYRLPKRFVECVGSVFIK